MIGRPFVVAVGQQEDDLFQHLREDALLEEDEVDAREAFEEETPDRRGVVHGQEFGGEDETEPSALAEEERGVNRERGPRRGEVRHRHSSAERGLRERARGLTGEVLIADVGRVPDQRPVQAGGSTKKTRRQCPVQRRRSTGPEQRGGRLRGVGCQGAADGSGLRARQPARAATAPPRGKNAACRTTSFMPLRWRRPVGDAERAMGSG